MRSENLRGAVRWLRRQSERINPQWVAVVALGIVAGTPFLSPVLGPLVTTIALLVVIALAILATLGWSVGRRNSPQDIFAVSYGWMMALAAFMLLLIFFVDHLEVGEIAVYKDKAVLVRRSGFVVGGNRPATFDFSEGLTVTLPVKVVDPQVIIDSLSEKDRQRLVAPVMVRYGTKTVVSRALGQAIVDSLRQQPLDQALRSHGLALSQAPSS